MAIINITPDSFSDGGRYLQEKEATDRAELVIKEGADVIDLGAQSTRPGGEIIGPNEELKRLLPVLKSIRSRIPNSIISIDTFHSEVAKKALEEGANWINDVTGSRYDNKILEVISDYKCPYVITHSKSDNKSIHSNPVYKDVVKEVHENLLQLTEVALSKGILEKNLIWDPGIGFSKTTDQNLSLLNNIDIFKKDNVPIIIGASRKRFIGEILNEPKPSNRAQGNMAVVCKCVDSKIDMVRVHDVKETVQTILVANKLWSRDS